MKRSMSEEEYVKRMGSRCPVCRSNDIEGGQIDTTTGGSAGQSMSCPECKSSWEDCYTLTGYYNLQEGKRKKEAI